MSPRSERSNGDARCVLGLTLLVSRSRDVKKTVLGGGALVNKHTGGTYPNPPPPGLFVERFR